jgi:hypothetical protein
MAEKGREMTRKSISRSTIDPGLAHFLFEGGHLFSGHEGVVGAMQDQHPALDVLGVFGMG